MNTMTKIIFLDVDGVINTPPYVDFNQRCLAQLYRIIDATVADIVVSSSWRCGDVPETKKLFVERGFNFWYTDRIIGETCRGYHFTVTGSYLAIVRGNEIKTWIDRSLIYPWHAQPKLDKEYRIYNEDGSFQKMRSNKQGKDFQYVILDDDSDMLYDQKDNFIHTNGLIGLTEKDADEAIRILNETKED